MARAKRAASSPETEETPPDPDYFNPNLVPPEENGEPGMSEVPSMLKPRAYQEEMLAESLRQNIIIAVCGSFFWPRKCACMSVFDVFCIIQMETGSGKTQM